jgi:hypothetical protein
MFRAVFLQFPHENWEKWLEFTGKLAKKLELSTEIDKTQFSSKFHLKY